MSVFRPFSRPLLPLEHCAWCYDARVVGVLSGEVHGGMWHSGAATRSVPCTFCGAFVVDADGQIFGAEGSYGNPYMELTDFYLRWRAYMEQLREVDLRAAKLTDKQLVAEGGMRQRFPRALSFFDRFRAAFRDCPYPDPVRFWVLTNPDLNPRRITA